MRNSPVRRSVVGRARLVQGRGAFFVLAASLTWMAHAGADVVVMTRNLYVGADQSAVIAAIAGGNAGQISAAASATYAQTLATNFTERSAAIAQEIDYARPALVGLQEVALYRSGPAGNPAPATHVEMDFLDILLNSLNARGLHYAAATVLPLSDVEVTTVIGANPTDLRLTDRDVILYNTDLTPAQLSLSNPQQSVFANNVVIPTPGGPLVVAEGWSSVDVQAGGIAFRFVSTHPVSGADPINVLQGNELLSGPLNTSLAQIIVGDFNSRGDGTGNTYNNMIAAGMHDAWSTVHPGDPGFTWGQDANLLNTTSHATKRIDFVMSRGGPYAIAADRMGEDPADRTPSGLWPSDHAGVVATLVPEPGTWTLAVLAAAGLAAARGVRTSARHQKKK